MEILDQPLAPPQDHVLATALAWWEGRRLWFDGVVLLAALAGFPFRPDTYGATTPMLIEIALWVVFANLAFCAGYLLEALLYHYGLGRLRLGNTRWVLFMLGTALVGFVTFSFVSLWYLPL